VCKAFDCFSSISTSFIYLLTLLFEDVYIIKPLRSRIVNSERYFVGKFMKRYRDRQ
jgi:23S rRNA U2552 (ribose-2'-O)-methylase RlmE/FtsJ